MTPTSPTDPLARREIRVFISSTFRDMMRERDLLVKRVFPALRRICAKRFVTFTEVDLRWGITEEQAAEGKVLPLCLAEIERSRPYFIGLLGERYGWVPGPGFVANYAGQAGHALPILSPDGLNKPLRPAPTGDRYSWHDHHRNHRQGNPRVHSA